VSILSFKKSYELPISRDYVRHWGMAEAVREIVQNALDSDSPFEYELTEDRLLVRSRHSTLSTSTLLLGQTSKATNTEKIGSFGEGYKIALLVLTRLGYKVRVLNGDRVWTPTFRKSRQFDAEVLCIEDAAADEKNEGVAFEVGGLSPGDVEAIREGCLTMQPNIGAVIETRYGRILRERPGKLHVGGLFVCETKLQFGYDVLPKFLRLERDRQTVSSFDLQLRTMEMWFDSGLNDEIAALLSTGCRDLDYAEYGAPELVKEACYKLFQKKHPGAVIAKDQDELEKLVKDGMTNVVFVGGAYGAAIREALSYQSSTVVRVLSPQQELEAWRAEHGHDLSEAAAESFDGLVARAGNWRVK